MRGSRTSRLEVTELSMRLAGDASDPYFRAVGSFGTASGWAVEVSMTRSGSTS